MKGYAWRLPQTRIHRIFLKKYEDVGKVVESPFLGTETSDEIRTTIREDLIALCRKGGTFAGRH